MGEWVDISVSDPDWPEEIENVCTRHMKFLPCRSPGGYLKDRCVTSSDPNDVALVRRYQTFMGEE